MTLKSYFLIPVLIAIASSTPTLEEYPILQQSTPEVIFQQIQHSDQIQHPEISKLVFITPWNPSSKTLTLKYAHKLKYISPCWYQLVLKNGKIVFQNDQLIDHQYLTQIKTANPNIKILPRLYVNNFEVFRQIGSNQNVMHQVSKLIFDTYQKHQFDGIVWDSPYNLFVSDTKMKPLNNLIFEYVNKLKSGFKHILGEQFLVFFNMANPGTRVLDNTLYKKLFIDGLLIQNYDSPLPFHQMLKVSAKWFSVAQPNVKEVFMMLPFFSYKNGQGISTMDAKKQLENDEISSQGSERGMCKFVSEKKASYLVPCYKYFSQAYKILKQSNLNAGYWEGGNGLENYYLFM